MQTIRRLAAIGLVSVPVVVAFSASSALASIVETDLSSGSETGFDANILSNDLINQGQATLSSLVATPGANFPATGSDDGTATHTNGLVYYAGPPTTGVDLTFNLNTNPGTGGSATGYSLSSINGIYGWQDSRYRHAAQEWVVSVETTSSPSIFQNVWTVLYTPFAANDIAAGSSQVTLTGSLPTNVTAINFHLSPYGAPNDPGYTGEIGVVREFDVVGTASVPEPASLGLLGLGGLGFLAAVVIPNHQHVQVACTLFLLAEGTRRRGRSVCRAIAITLHAPRQTCCGSGTSWHLALSAHMNCNESCDRRVDGGGWLSHCDQSTFDRSGLG